MQPRSAQATAGPGRRNETVRRPTFWCGALLVSIGLAAAVLPSLQPMPDARMLIVLLLAAGAIEAFAGILDHRAGGVTASLDIVLGLLSLFAGAVLLMPGWDSASSLFTILALWLIVRGLSDLIGSAVMRNEIIQDARLIRAGVDLGLGAASWIGLAIVPWWELIFGWPESSVSLITVFAGISLMATGAFLIAESQVLRARRGAGR